MGVHGYIRTHVPSTGVYASYMGIGRIVIRRLFNKKFLCIIFVGRFLTNRSNWSKLLTNVFTFEMFVM